MKDGAVMALTPTAQSTNEKKNEKEAAGGGEEGRMRL